MPVSSAHCAFDTCAADCEPSKVCSGLKPRNDANKLPTGGWFAMVCACAAPTPLAVSPLNIAEGSVFARPTIISEKKMPIDNTMPELRNVACTPAAPPRCSGGTLFMMAVEFGAENKPPPMPLSSTSTAKTQ